MCYINQGEKNYVIYSSHFGQEAVAECSLSDLDSDNFLWELYYNAVS